MPDHPAPGLPDAPLVAALRALPLAGPGAGAWPRLAARLAARRRRRSLLRRCWPVAAAAMLALALLPQPLPTPDRVGAPGSGGTAGRTQAGLIEQSQWLEHLLANPALSPPARDGDRALLELGLQDRLGGIDAALAEAGPDPAPALWQARVDTLAQLAVVRLGGPGESSRGAGASGTGGTPALLWAN